LINPRTSEEEALIGFAASELTAGSKVAIVLFGALVLGAAFVMPRFWRGEMKDGMDRGTASWWLFGEPLRKGLIRGVLVGEMGAATAFLTAVCVWVRQESTPPLRALADRGVTLFSLLFLIALLVSATVVLFNRPRFLMPPIHRDEPGAVRYWVEAWRRGGDPTGPLVPRSRRRHTDALGTAGAMLIGLALVFLVTYAGYFGGYGRRETPWLGWGIALLLIGVPAFVVAYRRTKRPGKGGSSRQGRP